MTSAKEALEFLSTEIGKKEKQQALNFEEYLELVKQEPRRTLRSIFQLFYDMIKSYVPEETDEYPDDPESIGFVKYDCSKLFVENADNPFFADRLFANRFVRQVESLRQGFQQNRVYAYLGPSGCGKSTFLNNLLRSFETYTNTKDGMIFEVVWEIDEHFFSKDTASNGTLTIPCPSHDCPILIIPKGSRSDFLARLLPEEIAQKAEIFHEKQYDWLFKSEVCTICRAIFRSSLDKLGSLEKVLDMVKVRPYKFDRRLGEGVSIFNPGDKMMWLAADGRPMGGYFGNRQLQEKLDRIFGINSVRYLYSPLAKTNNGVYVLMDVKLDNQERLAQLHNVISEGVHKVGDIEEPINSLFFALMNPEDKESINANKMESLQGRIHYNTIPYVLEPSTEVSIYLTTFGESVRRHFLPRILENFARVIIASRMKTSYDKTEPDPLKDWIPSMGNYKRYCDERGLLLKMEIYSGIIPNWITEEDRKKFTAPIRRELIAEGERQGSVGFSGRESLRLFSEFLNRYMARTNLINMDNLTDFFKHRIGRESRNERIPQNFLASLIDSYDYTVLGEIKQALYYYNQEQIVKDILNYLWAINHDVGTKTRCPFTGEEIEVTIDFLKLMASYLIGDEVKDAEALEFAKETQKKFVTLFSREKNIQETDLYRELLSAYSKNLREKALEPFANNINFYEAVKVFGTKEFETFDIDRRLREHIIFMMKNLIEKFGYTEQGAKEICLYVLDKKLAEKFS